MKIACVQHGNYTEARRVLAAGGAETYNAQRYSVESFERFVSGVPHVVISLGAADEHREVDGLGEFLGVPLKSRWKFMPRRVAVWRARRRITQTLERFGTTHLLLRCNDLMGCELLEWANRGGVRTGVLLAARFDPNRRLDRRFCELANHESVALVANHNRLATASLLPCGLRPEKAIAWDWEQAPGLTPADHAPKSLRPGTARSIMFAGVMSEAKGAGDVLAAWERLHGQGADVRLAMLGDGPVRERVLAHAGAKEGRIEAPGRVGHDEVVRRMRASDLIVVPSRHEFTEGLPMVIQEALALRTPLVLSDHPVFTGYFKDGEGVRFFPAGDADALARVIGQTLTNPSAYAQLSEATAAAWQSVQIDTKFHHVLESLAAEWKMPNGRASSLRHPHARRDGLSAHMQTPRP